MSVIKQDFITSARKWGYLEFIYLFNNKLRIYNIKHKITCIKWTRCPLSGPQLSQPIIKDQRSIKLGKSTRGELK